MKFWIVTPSYNQLDWLQLCVASVADQASEGLAQGAERIEVHHHIQDACSSDGTPEWLERYAQEVSPSGILSVDSTGQESQKSESSSNAQGLKPKAALSGYTFSYSSEPDNGMYDAINKGWKLASDDTDVIAHLNCDEQYLPGALKTIADFFEAHQKADVVLADMIVVDNDGEYICHRRSLKPYAWTSKYCCGGFTATTFQRAGVTKEKQVFFDISWRNIGDTVWYNALHKAGCRFAVCNQLVAVFTDTGENLNWTEEGLRERRRYEVEYLRGLRLGVRVAVLVGVGEMVLVGKRV